ncbi:MAG TPA: molecular chaperone HtpG, partial [Gammaproteobacteria bacterium]|nr:molecular chaperone HtpG [Gammaproteobacteria bacterium]
AALLRFATTQDDSEDQTISLADYISRMKVDQKEIYYVTAESHAAAKSSPHLEIFRKKGIEVLLLSDPIDEWLVSHLHEFDGKPLQSVTKGGLDLEEDVSKEIKKEAKKKYKDLIKGITSALGEQIKEVRISNRLTDSPACLVADENDMGANMERLLKTMGQDITGSKPILEINPDHDLIVRLNLDQKDVDDWAQVLFD